MADLSTKYLGLELKNPIIVGSSGLTSTVHGITECADNGAGAVVLKSLFEEQIIAETREETSAADMGLHPEAYNYVMNTIMENNIAYYINLLKDAKERVDIPVIASINCTSAGAWTEYAKDFENSGADALELNIFLENSGPELSAKELEDRYFDIVRSVRKQISLPIAVKISHQFTNPGRVIQLLAAEDIQGLVLFNRFMQMSIDLDKEELMPGKPFSHPQELSIPLKWIGMYSGIDDVDFCGTTGAHSPEDVLRLIFAGAQSVELVSALYKNGTDYLKDMLSGIKNWMDKKGYEKLDDFRGKLSAKNADLMDIYSRVQFMRYVFSV